MHLAPSLRIALLLLLAASPAAAQITTRASLDSSGAEGFETSVVPDLNSNAEVVAFYTMSPLVADDTNLSLDVFVRVLGTGVTERVSVSTAGDQGDLPSYWGRCDGSGDRITFSSYATNLVAGDTNGFLDIFVRDRAAPSTIRVSVDSAGNEANGDSDLADISKDGRYVVFQSEATNLVAGDTNNDLDVFWHDTFTEETIRVSVNDAGDEGNDDSFYAAISADGRYVAFHSDATNLVAGDTNGARDVFVRDTLLETTIRVSVDSSGNQGNGDSYAPAISGLGDKVAFVSWASNLVTGDTNVQTDIFVHDIPSGETTRVSVDSSGGQSNGTSGLPDIAENGEVVAFQSWADNLVAADTNSTTDVFVHSMVTGETNRASVDSAGNEANSTNGHPSLDSQGLHVAFQSLADNLVAGDTNLVRDVYVRQGLALYFPLDPAPGDPVEFATYSELDAIGDQSLVLLSCSGTSGFDLGRVRVPLTYDACTTLGLRLSGALFATFDGSRYATTPRFTLPDVPAGTRLYAAAVTLRNGMLQHVTEPIEIVVR